MKYSYEAVDCTGETVSDQITAKSFDEAVQIIRSKGLFVVKLLPDIVEPDSLLEIKSRLLELHERQKYFEKKAAEAKQRMKISYLMLGLAGINMIFSFYGLFTHNHLITFISFPISILICMYSIRIMRQSAETKAKIKELDELLEGDTR